MSKKTTKALHSRVIDDFDLKRISQKVLELEKLITWLKRLKEVDSTVNPAEIDEVISHIRHKKSKLKSKAETATAEQIEEAELLAAAYTIED